MPTMIEATQTHLVKAGAVYDLVYLIPPSARGNQAVYQGAANLIHQRANVSLLSWKTIGDSVLVGRVKYLADGRLGVLTPDIWYAEGRAFHHFDLQHAFLITDASGGVIDKADLIARQWEEGRELRAGENQLLAARIAEEGIDVATQAAKFVIPWAAIAALGIGLILVARA